MAITDNGVAAIAAIIGNSGLSVPGYFAVGSGNTAESSSDTTLDHEYDRNSVTSTDLDVANNVTWVGDFNSTEVSGLTMVEFGLFNSGTGGNLFHREVIGSIAFEGDRELQIQSTFRFSRSGA